ncbi:fam-l protein [Plasmodium malariae]|uniref:Fam-l protein n=1 Tax=Plasmodium malariae TaxID=5858 RepID=A0A1D3JHE3_PLAMA|nr:fam-l protein [Plasmodium malariae]SBT85590.1 fam-l protein [Plasmodium malariae]
MEIKIIILLLVKIFAFIFLPWRSYFNNDMSLFNNSLNEMYSFHRKLDTRVRRLLSKYKQDIYSNILGIKDDLPYNEENKKKSVYSNENDKKVRTKSTKGSSLNKAGNHKQDKNYNSCIFETKNYSRFEKKIFKELDYEDFLKKNRTISDKLYKKIILKKYGLRLALPLLLFLLLFLSLILDLSGEFGLQNMLRKVLNISGANDWMKKLGQNFSNLIGVLGLDS